MATTYLCPHCGDRADFAGRCDACAIDRIDAARFPPWGLRGVVRDEALPTEDPWGRAIAGVACAGIGLAGAHAFADGIFSQTALHVATLGVIVLLAIEALKRSSAARTTAAPRRDRRGLLVALAIVTLLGFTLLPLYLAGVATPIHPVDLDGVVLGTLVGASLLRPLAHNVLPRHAPDADAEDFAAAAVTAVAAAGAVERVKVRGRVRVVRPTFGPDGAACAAYETRHTSAAWRSIRAQGGVFDVVDADGAVARVSGEWLRVLTGRATGELHAIEDGDEVEVLGAGRWVADEAHEAGGPRDASEHLLEMTGTEDRPLVASVVARRDDDAPSGSLAVRIALDAPHDAADEDDDDAAPPSHADATRRAD